MTRNTTIRGAVSVSILKLNFNWESEGECRTTFDLMTSRHLVKALNPWIRFAFGNVLYQLLHNSLNNLNAIRVRQNRLSPDHVDPKMLEKDNPVPFSEANCPVSTVIVLAIWSSEHSWPISFRCMYYIWYMVYYVPLHRVIAFARIVQWWTHLAHIVPPPKRSPVKGGPPGKRFTASKCRSLLFGKIGYMLKLPAGSTQK